MQHAPAQETPAAIWAAGVGAFAIGMGLLCWGLYREDAGRLGLPDWDQLLDG